MDSQSLFKDTIFATPLASCFDHQEYYSKLKGCATMAPELASRGAVSSEFAQNKVTFVNPLQTVFRVDLNVEDSSPSKH